MGTGKNAGVAGPTVLGINFWLVALLVPLWLGGTASLPAGATMGGVLQTPVLLTWLVSPLPLVLLGVGLRFRAQKWAQLALLVGVPLLTLLPTADGPLASAKLHPRVGIVVQLVLLLAYLVAVSAMLARLPSAPPGDAASASASALGGEPARSGAMAQGEAWQHVALDVDAAASRGEKPPSMRLRRRIFVYRLFAVVSVTVPALLLYAIGLDEDNVRALRQAFGSPGRVAAAQATSIAATTMLWAVVAHFALLGPLRAHLEHDRVLRGHMKATREAARRGRPRWFLYLAMVLALGGMGLLIWWSLQ